MKKLPVQGSGRGYAPGRIPVAVNARLDFRSGVLDLAAASEIPPQYLLYGAGVLAALKLGERAVKAIASRPQPAPQPSQTIVIRHRGATVRLPPGSVLGGGLDLLGALPWDGLS